MVRAGQKNGSARVELTKCGLRAGFGADRKYSIFLHCSFFIDLRLLSWTHSLLNTEGPAREQADYGSAI